MWFSLHFFNCYVIADNVDRIYFVQSRPATDSKKTWYRIN